MIPFEGQYTRKQWRRGIQLAMRPTGRDMVLRLGASVLILASLGFIVISLLQGKTQGADGLRLVRLAISIALLGYWVLSPYLRARRIESRAWRASAGRLGLRGGANGEGLILKGASGAERMERWDTFTRAHVRDDMVVLLGRNGVATILPRDFFPSEEDWQGFRQLVAFNVVEPK